MENVDKVEKPPLDPVHLGPQQRDLPRRRLHAPMFPFPDFYIFFLSRRNDLQG
jgi:hypothetical protein